MDPSQLQTYIHSSRNNGLSDDAIRNSLLQSGWPTETVNTALKVATPMLQAADPHRVRNGVLLILSPFIILITSILIQLLFRAAGIHSAIVNIISLLAGIAGLIMLPLGPILGIIKLSRH